jgi:outer membrane protein assembly factor BamB
VATTRAFPFVFFLIVGVAGLFLTNSASAASCEAILGKWMWFIGGEVTVNPDGTFTQQSGNTGTWECTDATKGAVTLRWRQGGFVNRMLLSPDGQSLSSLDPSQMFVTAKRIGVSTEAKQVPQESKQPLQKVTPEDPQEIGQLLERMSSNYKDTLLFDGDSEGEYIQKGVEITLLRDYVGKETMLILNFHVCDLTGVTESKNYNASVDSVDDCNKNRQGLSWEQNLFETAPLTHIDPLSIKISQLDRRQRWSALNSVKHEGLHVTFDFVGYKAKSGTITSIVCKNRSACEQMAADLKALVTLVQKSTATKPTSSLQSVPRTGEESRSAVSNTSQEATQLMERFKQNYSRTAIEFYRPRDSLSDGYIRKGHAVALEQGFTLVERYIECNLTEAFWSFAGDGLPYPYPHPPRMSVDTVTDCDKQRYGLKWEETTVRRPLADIDPPSIKLSTTDVWGDETDLHISFEAYRANETEFEKEYAIPGYTISCKDRNACEQMAADLKRLVEIARKFTVAKTTPSPEPQPKTAQEPRHAQSDSAQAMPRLRWKFESTDAVGSSSPIRTSPTVADGVVYVRNADSYLYAIDTKSGQEKWTFQVQTTPRCSPAVADGVAYVCDGSALYAVEVKTGRQLWILEDWEIIGIKAQMAGVYDVSTGSKTPTIANGMIYLGGGYTKVFGKVPGRESGEGYGCLIAVDAKTGQLKRAIKVEAPFRSTPAVTDGIIYVGRSDGQLYAVDESSFDPKTRRRPTTWTFKTGGSVESSPKVANGVVYFGSNDSHLYAVDITTHQEKWRFKTGGKVRLSPALANGVVYVGSDDSHLYALDANTGQERWRFKTGGSVGSSPAVVDGLVYVGSDDSHLYALDANTGQERWRFKTGGAVASSPAVADGVVYVGSEDGYLYAINK